MTAPGGKSTDSCVGEMYRVGLTGAVDRTSEAGSKPVPVTTSVNAPDPGCTEGGDRLVMVGTTSGAANRAAGLLGMAHVDRVFLKLAGMCHGERTVAGAPAAGQRPGAAVLPPAMACAMVRPGGRAPSSSTSSSSHFVKTGPVCGRLVLASVVVFME